MCGGWGMVAFLEEGVIVLANCCPQLLFAGAFQIRAISNIKGGRRVFCQECFHQAKRRRHDKVKCKGLSFLRALVIL